MGHSSIVLFGKGFRRGGDDANVFLLACSIDGLNTSTIGLLDLRRRLAIIPQDAALFEGTIRDNLDPRHVHDDTELWSVLEHARLKEYVSGLEGQLDATVHEGGECTAKKPHA
jgi:ABC-type multidrug transport system fused ATPase/permease subunit